MARPADNSLKYYNRDVKDDDNLQYVEAVHGLIGYAIVDKLWKHIYSCPGGYYCEFGEINQRLFCKKNGISLDDLHKILATCFQEGIAIFSQEQFEKNKILTSSGVQKRWSRIVREAGRKQCEIRPEYYCIRSNGEETIAAVVFSGEETTPPVPLPVRKIPQSKVKESKRKKSKVKETSDTNPTGGAPAKPAPKATSAKNDNEEPPEPFWEELVKIWFAFHKKNSLDEPSFTGRNPRFLKNLIQLLKKRSARKNIEWTCENACSSLQYFLAHAFADEWLKSHFLLENLVKQFDAVYQRAILQKQAKKEMVSSQNHATAQGIAEEIKFLYERFVDNELDDRLLLPEYYDKMVTRNMLPVGSLDKHPGPTIDEKKKQAILEFFQHQRSLEKQTA